MENKKGLTVAEVIEYTGFSKSYLYKLTSAGSIPFSKPNGKLIFFEKEKLEQWLLGNPCAGNYIKATDIRNPLREFIKERV